LLILKNKIRLRLRLRRSSTTPTSTSTWVLGLIISYFDSFPTFHHSITPTPQCPNTPSTTAILPKNRITEINRLHFNDISFIMSPYKGIFPTRFTCFGSIGAEYD
jgi:hypothetical protein